MKENIYLNKLDVGEIATVNGIFAEKEMRQRLEDLGIVEGTQIKCLMKSPLGDPTAFLIRGSVIALRREDSKNIGVSVRGG